MTLLTLHLIPNARRTAISREPSGGWRIRLTAPAVEGKANAALITLLAKTLQVPKRQITLIQGHKSRHKVVQIESLTEEEVSARMTEASKE